MPNRDIIVIGLSHGGTEPVKQLIRKVSADLRASVFIVRHIPPEGQNYLVDILAHDTSLPVISAGHCEDIRKSTVHIAPANFHLLVNATQTYLSSGPRENLFRPAIDPLFRSAAVTFGPRVIGIVLSGELDDGTAGLSAIKKCGGLVIVQDPATAIAPSMPESVVENVAVDHVLPAGAIGTLLNDLVQENVSADFRNSDEMKKELAVLAGNSGKSMDIIGKEGRLVDVGCPACGGPLIEMEGKFRRYRCHIGHAFTGRTLIQGLEESEEQALFAALRVMEERVRMLRKLHKDASGHYYGERLEEAETQARQLRGLLQINEGGQWNC